MCVESAPLKTLSSKMMDYQKQSQVRMMADGESPLEIACRRLSSHCYDPNVEAVADAPARSPPPTAAPVLNSTPVNPFRTCSSPSDAPIDLSQLSTRRGDPTKRLASDARSASESCLALGRKKFRLDEKGHSLEKPLAANPTVDGRFPHWRITDDGRIVDSAPSGDLLKQRSMSSADLCAYGNRLAMDVESRLRREVTPQPETLSWNHVRKSSASPASPSTTSPASSSRHTSPPDDMQLKYVLQRCMSDSRLTGIIPSSSNIYSDLQRIDPEEEGSNERLECLLRRTASESIIPSRSTEAAALEVIKRQQQLIQQHYQQLLQHGAGEGSPPDPSSYLANPFLYLQLFGYSHMLQSFQAQEYFKKMSNSQTHPAESGPASGQVSAGPSSPVPSPSGSDECDPAGGSSGLNGNKRRSPRALTGKHVRLGTGASPTTLHTLRLKIEERQKLQKLKTLPKGSNWSAGASNNKKIAGKVKGRAK